MKENYISQEGLDKLKIELEELTKVKRPEVINRISLAREQGDLSENAEYHEAREDQGFLEGRIQEIEYLTKNATLIKSDKKFANLVSDGRTR